MTAEKGEQKHEKEKREDREKEGKIKLIRDKTNYRQR